MFPRLGDHRANPNSVKKQLAANMQYTVLIFQFRWGEAGICELIKYTICDADHEFSR